MMLLNKQTVTELDHHLTQVSRKRKRMDQSDDTCAQTPASHPSPLLAVSSQGARRAKPPTPKLVSPETDCRGRGCMWTHAKATLGEPQGTNWAFFSKAKEKGGRAGNMEELKKYRLKEHTSHSSQCKGLLLDP